MKLLENEGARLAVGFLIAAVIAAPVFVVKYSRDSANTPPVVEQPAISSSEADKPPPVSPPVSAPVSPLGSPLDSLIGPGPAGLELGLEPSVRDAVNAARAAAAEAAITATQARSSQMRARDISSRARTAAERARNAAVRARDAAQKGESRVPGFGILTGTNTEKLSWRYAGELTNNGIRKGAGVIAFSNGQRYEGEWDDLLNGYGVYAFPSGERFEGEFRNDRRNGLGVHSYSDGGSYEGEQHDDSRSGFGIQAFDDGAHYEGEYRAGSKTAGVYLFPDGDHYEGGFRNEKLGGVGVYYGGNSRQYREEAGEFVDDALNGHAVIRWKDGSRDEGTWKDAKLEGYAARFDAKGAVVEQGSFSGGELRSVQKIGR